MLHPTLLNWRAVIVILIWLVIPFSKVYWKLLDIRLINLFSNFTKFYLTLFFLSIRSSFLILPQIKPNIFDSFLEKLALKGRGDIFQMISNLVVLPYFFLLQRLSCITNTFCNFFFMIFNWFSKIGNLLLFSTKYLCDLFSMA